MTKIEFKLWKAGNYDYKVKNRKELKEILELYEKEKFKPLNLPESKSLSHFRYPTYTHIRDNMFRFGKY
jgi:hypothetical protein